MELHDSIECVFAEIERNSPDKTVELLAATKCVSPEIIDRAYDYGVRVIGENRVQELLEKYDKVKKPFDWRFIGRLQTNKVKYIIDKVSVIQSLDSVKLLDEIDRHAAKKRITTGVFVEANMGREEDKGGVLPEKVIALCDEVAVRSNVALMGIMCVFPKNADEKLYDEAKGLFDSAVSKYPSVQTLSMGMSGDYVTALRHGATQIRVGTAIFGKR